MAKSESFYENSFLCINEQMRKSFIIDWRIYHVHSTAVLQLGVGQYATNPGSSESFKWKTFNEVNHSPKLHN